MKKEIILAYTLKNAAEHSGFAQPSSIISGLFNHGLKKENIKKIMPEINNIMEQVNSLKPEEQQILYEKHKHLITYRETREGMPELDKVPKSGVIMRFAPSPSGPLHIGHALSASASYLYVKKYNGKFYIRIEDTNPENIYKPAYKMIEKEAKWLFENNCKIIIQSDRLPIYYKYAEKLIKLNKAYVCTCDKEQFKTYIKNKKQCPCRNLPLNQQKERWEKMLSKSKTAYQPGQAVLRFKSDMKHKNPAFRDFPLARINTTPHPLQKNKYRVWPLMNLSVTADDIELKITHIIRAKEHRDNAKRQELIYKTLNKPIPKTYFLGRIHLKDFKLSASQITKDIKAGKYKGWDDPRLPTIQSLKKQGYKPQAFHKLAEQIGLNEVDKNIDKKELLKLLDTFNK